MKKYCIYKIELKSTGKVYIGATSNEKTRFATHIRKLNKKSHYNQQLQADWNEFGKDRFEFSVIEYLDKESVKDREEFWIKNSPLRYNKTEFSVGRPEPAWGESVQVRIPIIYFDAVREYVEKYKNSFKNGERK